MSNAYRSVLKSSGVAPTGDAVAGDVLAGKTFSNENAVGITGTMPNRGAVSQTITAGQSYTIPEGYHNGGGTVAAAMPSEIHSVRLSGTTFSGAYISTATNNLSWSGSENLYSAGHVQIIRDGSTGTVTVEISSSGKLFVAGSEVPITSGTPVAISSYNAIVVYIN